MGILSLSTWRLYWVGDGFGDRQQWLQLRSSWRREGAGSRSAFKLYEHKEALPGFSTLFMPQASFHRARKKHHFQWKILEPCMDASFRTFQSFLAAQIRFIPVSCGTKHNWSCVYFHECNKTRRRLLSTLLLAKLPLRCATIVWRLLILFLFRSLLIS